jgi:hypothetical protein
LLHMFGNEYTYPMEVCGMFTSRKRKYTTSHDSLTQRVPHIIMCTQEKAEFLKYNNICSLTAILNESISKLCGLSTKYAQI